GSYRNIEIIRGNEKKTADLYEFLVEGSQKGNVLLQEGDVVRIPYYENQVSLTGNVKRPGKFELKHNETFNDLLKYSGGFTDSAYRGAVTVERITDSLRKIIDLPASGFATFRIKGSDKYTISKLQDEFGNRIYITGAVQRPGPYEWTKGITAKDLITKAGGLTVDAYTQKALIYRYEENMQPEMKSVNLDSVLQHGNIISLQRNDSLVINTISFFKEKETISINGNVRLPSTIPYRKNMLLSDAIQSAGGITEAGDSSNVELSRRIKTANVEEANHQESTVININLYNHNAAAIPLQPYDLILIKDKPGYIKQRTVTVIGEVMSPGIYALEKSGARITDVIYRVKGFKASADSSSLMIRRVRNQTLPFQERKNTLERILNIDQDSLARNQKLSNELNKDFDLISVHLTSVMANPESPANLQLEDGDVLTVERASNTVKVTGEVYFPSVIPFRKGENLKYYVQQAGNFMPRARKTGALVINPNGKTTSVKHFLFFKSYPEVTARSEVFVPQKEISNRQRMGATEWAVIISALGIISNIIINVTK
ncbi:MAG TPA: SLBB domain-containing protein, partial [Ginsengibacter sp.]|nr:SLBB domain-containing protein [Ginsengibacter sp.]